MSAPGKASKGLGPGVTSLGVRFLLLAIVACALMVVDYRTTRLESLREGFSFVVYPVQMLVNAPPSAWRWATTSLAERRELLAANEQLKREQLHANAKLQRLDALEAENRRLRELLDSTARLAD